MKKSLKDLRWYAPKHLFKYPHMFGLEAHIMDKWIEKFGDVAINIAYDIPVGDGRSVGEQSTIKLDLGARYSTSYKIDAVADMGGFYYLIEVKGSGNLEGIGQLVSYKQLIFDTYIIDKPVHLKLICTDCHPDLYTVAKAHLIDIVILDISKIT